MALTNYAELQTAIASWTHRDDLTSILPDLITLAEARINRDLRIRAMENTATGTITSGLIALPTGFLEAKALTLTYGASYRELEYVPPNRILPEQGSTGNSGIPWNYTIIGDNIQVEATGSASYTLVYYKKFDALSAGVNWLITNAPDVYLYGTLLEAAPYMKDDKRIDVWAGMYAKAIESLRQQDNKDRYGPSLRVVAA